MKRALLGTALSVVGLFATSAAYAQGADADEEIVVTAQRRAQSVQDVPIALSVISGEQLAEKNINVVNDIENAVPNLEVDSQFGGGQPQFRIRGIGAREYSSNNASTVGVYVDEAAHPYTVTTQGALFDVARIEVLRGPQGTLYGRNTTGGAVNIITNAPTETLSAGLSAEYGSYERSSVTGFISGPLSSALSGRVAFIREQGGAWQYNRDTNEALGDVDRTGVRGRLTIEPTENVSIDLSANYARDQSDGLGFRLLTPYAAVGGPTYPPDTQWRITGWRISPGLAAIAGVSTDADPFRDNEGLDLSAVARIDLGGVLLTSVTASQRFDRNEYNDWDGTRFYESDVFFFNDIDVLSQEFRLSSDGAGPLEWLVGLHYAEESNDGGFYTQFRGRTDIILTPYEQDVEAAGIFANATYNLTDRLSVSGGLRYEDEERRLRTPGTIVGFDATTGAAPAGPAPTWASYSTGLNEWSGRLGLEYRLGENALLYGSIARGVKSGGFTTYNANSALPFRPEIVIAYEAGLKSDWADGRVVFNTAAFYYDYEDQQVQGIEYDAIVGRLGKITNVPESHIYGFEADLSWEIFEGFRVSQYASIKFGEYDEYFAVDDAATAAANPPAGPWTTIISTDRSGERLGFPRETYGGAISYDWTWGNYALRAETNYAYRGDLYSVTSASAIPDYWLANANLGIGPADRNWRVALWGRNIFDQYFEESRNGFNSSSRRTASPHQPQTWGVRLDVNH